MVHYMKLYSQNRVATPSKIHWNPTYLEIASSCKVLAHRGNSTILQALGNGHRHQEAWVKVKWQMWFCRKPRQDSSYKAYASISTWEAFNVVNYTPAPKLLATRRLKVRLHRRCWGGSLAASDTDRSVRPVAGTTSAGGSKAGRKKVHGTAAICKFPID
jgi:hypothetical protein